VGSRWENKLGLVFEVSIGAVVVRRGTFDRPPRRPFSGWLGSLKLMVLGRKLHDGNVSDSCCV
jgi:hypothetical protein